MKYAIKEIVAPIEAFAPASLAEEYDNTGLIVGDRDAKVEGALLCVDITSDVLDEAVEKGIKLVISHHPVIFRPLYALTGANEVQRLVERALKEGIALYAAHTNLDNAPGGMSHMLASQLGIKEVNVLKPGIEPGSGGGAIGELAEPENAKQFLERVKRELRLPVLRHSELCVKKVRRVALCTGAGGFTAPDALRAGADVFLSADLKYNHFMEGEGRMIVADIGHYESEYCALELLDWIIRKKFTTFALHRSVKMKNPVNYL